MAVIFDCPFCSYNKKVPDRYYHKKLKCPRCLATITLGVPQPTKLTALPLPEEEMPLDQTAIVVDTSNAMIECSVCFELIDPKIKRCPYCHNNLEQDLFLETWNLEDYLKNINKIKNCYYLGMFSLICGLGLILGPIAIWQSFYIKDTLFEYIGKLEKHMSIAGMIMGITGTLGSLILVIGILL